MRARDRDNREQDPAEGPQAAAAGTGADDCARRARMLLDHGDELIRRALSGDSEEFLAQNPQQDGE